MDEAELCDRVLLVHEGRVLAQGTPSEVTAQFSGGLLRVAAEDAPRLAPVLVQAGLAPGSPVRFGDSLHLTYPVAQREHLTRLLAEAGIAAEPVAPGIEDVFVALVTAQPVEAS